jgi:aryl-alcohol dehydrogenase-like predicted oxidoreductase
MSAPSGKPHGYPPLSTVLPPLVLGTATFNYQYVDDPNSMPATAIVARSLELGITAFDTSPYYGPSETILGAALSSVLSSSPSPISRSSLTLITKCGRIGPATFDYSPAQVRYSVLRSLRRLATPYLDLVYAHDVEFVTDAEVLAAVTELRRLRDEDGLIRYVGISGFPLDRVVALAELIRRETGEGVDAVLSYGNFTVQNRVLGRAELERGSTVPTESESARTPLQRLKDAGVGVVLNASMLGMGLLTSAGIPTDTETATAEDGKKASSPLAKWHPSPPPLRVACKKLAALSAEEGERLESVAIRWSLAEWARIGGAAGLGVETKEGVTVGPTVMGVKSVSELEETAREWQGCLNALKSRRKEDEADFARHEKILKLVEKKMWPTLGQEWLDYSWASPGDDYVNQLKEEERGVVPQDDGVLAGYEAAKAKAAKYRQR